MSDTLHPQATTLLTAAGVTVDLDLTESGIWRYQLPTGEQGTATTAAQAAIDALHHLRNVALKLDSELAVLRAQVKTADLETQRLAQGTQLVPPQTLDKEVSEMFLRHDAENAPSPWPTLPPVEVGQWLTDSDVKPSPPPEEEMLERLIDLNADAEEHRTLTVTLDAGAYEELAREARTKGRTIEELAGNLLAEAIRYGEPSVLRAIAIEAGEIIEDLSRRIKDDRPSPVPIPTTNFQDESRIV